MRITDIPTPAVLVDSSKLTRNLSRMQAAANAGGKRLRPHAKTHKSPRIAALQIERGAVGICCAKLGEAEVMADEGIRASDFRVVRRAAAKGGATPSNIFRATLNLVLDQTTDEQFDILRVAIDLLELGLNLRIARDLAELGYRRQTVRHPRLVRQISFQPKRA